MMSRTGAVGNVVASPPNGCPTRVGLVGCGYWGPNLIRVFAALPQAELVMVCDLVAERLEPIGAQYPGVQLTTDYAALLASDVEAVVVATAIGSHYRLVKRALLAGKHVLVEKPLTSNVREAIELVALAEARGLLLMVDHTFLFEPAVERLRDLVQSGELGTIWDIRSERLNLGLFRQDANVLWDLAPHDVSILLEVLNVAPLVASARGTCHVQPGIQDVADLELRFPGDLAAHVHLSWLAPGKVRRLSVVGSRKMAVYDDLATAKLQVFDRAVIPAGASATGALLYRIGETVSIPLPPVEPLRRQCACFLDALRAGGWSRRPAQQALHVVRILAQADSLLQNGDFRQEGSVAAPGSGSTPGGADSSQRGARALARQSWSDRRGTALGHPFVKAAFAGIAAMVVPRGSGSR